VSVNNSRYANPDELDPRRLLTFGDASQDDGWCDTSGRSSCAARRCELIRQHSERFSGPTELEGTSRPVLAVLLERGSAGRSTPGWVKNVNRRLDVGGRNLLEAVNDKLGTIDADE
jgi:hypothetical protein